ncbi:LolA family protein [Salinibacillus xinjiangensis]|uniref:Outer membrane lipoprotein carrier protein LolA n=1 Tax=Salinibacillus xinjiangensis TaxID=1229268 RepID=A0A6G1X889_9BACI|nr:outer membrane lipoprotein carrier protein LolA [Salinibacillus xinjiangensis]MRG87221.1 outer membrane lipoprotein carrier protein LolA [Salinibacillus xinjiangensis]
MKKKHLLWSLAVFLLIFLAACGEKSKEDIVNSLEKQAEEMSGYKAQAKMNLKTGEEVQSYEIDVWHKKKDLYRVQLNNPSSEKGNQIILKNSEGVFVLTPALNKSFKFQSEWPDNSSQPYLYSSLVNDIMNDQEAEFKTTEDYYVFTTKTNYQSNKNLPYQEITFDKETLKPVLVKVMDKDYKSLVEITFSSFEYDPKFAEDDFDTKKNLTSSSADVPAMANAEEEVEMQVLYPLNLPEGTSLVEERKVDFENGTRVILTFEGDKNFTLIQEKYTAYPTSISSPVSVEGDPVDLGFTVGALSDGTVEWSNNNTRFYLASEDLTREELIEVASSVEGKSYK